MNVTFVLLETLGIQSYIFRSNRLRENLGASELVARATTDWVWEAVHGKAPVAVTRDAYAGQRCVEEGAASEVLLTAGGNALIACASRAEARRVVRAVSERALVEAPGLRLNAAVAEREWDGETLGEIRSGLANALTQTRADALATSALAGLSVTATCRSTGQPATHREAFDGDAARPISSEIAAKLAAAESATGRLRSALQDLLPGDVVFGDDLDQLGRTRDSLSTLAVVHADGNGIGAFFRDATVEGSLRAQIAGERERSLQVDRAAMRAVQQTVSALAAALHPTPSGYEVRAPGHDDATGHSDVPTLHLHTRRGRSGAPEWVLPLRPIVFGGDDVTFVCDGRLGLSLADAFLRAFEASAAAEGLNVAGRDAVTASAGVAIVKAHYPFAQAYALAEELAASAKLLTRATGGAGALDWHIAESAIYTDDIAAIRLREQTVPSGRMTLRPYGYATAPDLGVRHFEAFEDTVAQFRASPGTGDGEADWSTRRNKVKRLREVLREGPTATEAFVDALRARTPRLRLPDSGHAHPDAQRTGWGDVIVPEDGGGAAPHALYADAIDALDLHLPLR